MTARTPDKSCDLELLDLRLQLTPADREIIETLIHLLSVSTSKDRAAALSLLRDINESAAALPKATSRRVERAISYLRSRAT